MTMGILNCGTCEEFKAGVHGLAWGLAALMGLYNAAAWLSRRERHLAVNAVLYSAVLIWEHQHVAHHWRQRPQNRPEQPPVVAESVDDVEKALDTLAAA